MANDPFWHVFDAGAGRPLVFLHNGGGTFLNWAYQLEYFLPNYRVIAPDLPGFGRSARLGLPLTLDLYVQGLKDQLDRLNISKPILIGNCIGSSIALEFALREPERVAALALFNVCGGLPMLSPQLQFWAGLRPVTALGRRLHQLMVDTASHPILYPLNAPLLYAGGHQNYPRLCWISRHNNAVSLLCVRHCTGWLWGWAVLVFLPRPAKSRKAFRLFF